MLAVSSNSETVGASYEIAFSINLNRIQFNFAMYPAGDRYPYGNPVYVQAFENGTLVGSTISYGEEPLQDGPLVGHAYQVPEGIGAFSGVPFNSVVITGGEIILFTDNIDVVTVVPEPSAISLGVLALIGVGFGSLARRLRGHNGFAI